MSNGFYNIPIEAFDQAIHIANKAGRQGAIVDIQWIAPPLATSDPNGGFAVAYRNPTIDDV